MMNEFDDASLVASICASLLDNDLEGARNLARERLPFIPIPKKAKSSTIEKKEKNNKQGKVTRKGIKEINKLLVWQRDGYRCRYTGKRLVFPQTLELLSLILPQELPYDNPPHGKYDRTHILMWELFPVIDHVVPVRSHSDPVVANNVDNLVTASAMVNSEKSDIYLDDLGWKLHPPEPLADWDGLTTWYVTYLEQNKHWLDHPTSKERLKRGYNLLSTLGKVSRNV